MKKTIEDVKKMMEQLGQKLLKKGKFTLEYENATVGGDNLVFFFDKNNMLICIGT